MSVLIYILIVSICLALGGISSGVYVTVQRSKDAQLKDQRDAPSVIPVVSLIMVGSLLLAGMVCAIYYAMSIKCFDPKNCPKSECERCLFNAKDFRDFEAAEKTIEGFAAKTKKIPRKVAVTGECPDGVCVDPFSGDSYLKSQENLKMQRDVLNMQQQALAQQQAAVKSQEEWLGRRGGVERKV